MNQNQNCELSMGTLLEEGTLLENRFLVRKALAKGGMGMVYLAFDSHLQKQVIVKLSEHKALEQEAILQNELTHQAFPKVLDLIKEEKMILLVMEYVEGLTLKEYIERKGALDEQEIFRIGIQVLEAMAYLHSKRPAIFYQDLKPENVMIQKDGKVRLIDLGAAVQRKYDGSTLNAMGTKGYAAPEQRAGNVQEIDARTDVYAFGALLYSMATGIFLNVPPYVMEPLNQVCKETSNRLKYLIEKCTAQAMEERFSTIEEIQKMLDSSKKDQYFAKRRKAESHNSTGWIKGVRGAKVRRRGEIKRIKTVFLTAKTTPGLWVFALVIQLLLCRGLVLTQPVGLAGIQQKTVQKTKQDKLQGAIQGVMAEMSQETRPSTADFPLTVYDNDGRKLLIKHGSIYQVEGSLFFELPCEALPDENPEILTISLKNSIGESVKERTFFLERK